MSAPKIPRVQPYEPDDPHQKIGSLEMGEIEICCSPVKMKLFSILLTPFSYRLTHRRRRCLTLDGWQHSGQSDLEMEKNSSMNTNNYVHESVGLHSSEI